MTVFQQDEHNSEHIARHAVDEVEFEDAFMDPDRVRFSAHSGNEGFIGKTEGRRILAVIFTRLSSGQVRPITARHAKESEKQFYRRRNR